MSNNLTLSQLATRSEPKHDQLSTAYTLAYIFRPVCSIYIYRMSGVYQLLLYPIMVIENVANDAGSFHSTGGGEYIWCDMPMPMNGVPLETSFAGRLMGKHVRVRACVFCLRSLTHIMRFYTFLRGRLIDTYI